MSVWNIPGNQVGAVAQWTNYRTYFFTPNGDYYRFNDRTFRVDAGYPRDVATLWQGCTNIQEEVPESNDDGDNGVSGLAPSLLAVIVSVVPVLGTFNL